MELAKHGKSNNTIYKQEEQIIKQNDVITDNDNSKGENNSSDAEDLIV